MSYYRFPASLDGYHQIHSVKELENKLIDAARNAGFSHRLYIQLNLKQQQGIIYLFCTFCQGCKWSMKYERIMVRKAEGEFDLNAPFVLTRFNLYHYHANYPMDDMLTKGRRCQRIADKDGNEEIILTLAEMEYSHTQTCGYVNYLTGVPHLTARFIFYNSQTKKLVADFEDNFHEWYQTFKRKNLQIFTYPSIDKAFHFPDITFITCEHTMEEYKCNGHVTGIKLIDNKVKELSSSFQKYLCVAFYGYLGSNLHLLFGFAILSLGNQLNFQINTHPGKDAEPTGPNHRKKSVKVYSNLYKLLRVFIGVMGPTLKTLIVEDKLRIIQTAEYFAFKENEKREKSNHIKIIVDPIDRIHRRYPKNLHPLLINMCLSQTTEQWASLYRSVADSVALSLSEREIIDRFYEERSKFMVYNSEDPKFVGRWFQDLHYLSYQLIDSTNSCKRSILYLLVYVSNSFICLKKRYSQKFVSMIEHGTIEGILQFEIIKQIRLTMYKDGFRLIAEQLFLTNKLNCVYSYSTKLTPCKFTVPNQSPDSLPHDSKRKHQMKQGKPVNHHEQQLSDQQSQPISSRQVKEKSQLSNWKSEEELPGEGKKEKSMNKNLFARYEDLYPLKPPTIVYSKQPPPPKCIYEENDRFYICELEATEPQIKYKCDCNLLIFKGIPCRHILRTCLVYNFPIAHYISDYWKLKRPYNEWKEYMFMSMGMDQPKRGRPKHSARNRMRQR